MNIPDCYDPAYWAERLESALDAALEKLPVCECCQKPIQDDYTWEINDELLCEDCAAAKYRRNTDNFVME